VVALDQGARELALAPDELEAVPLERALARAALAERLTLDHQRPDPQAEALDGILVHRRGRSFAARLHAPAANHDAQGLPVRLTRSSMSRHAASS
jgi:hypothetical protein